MSWLSNIFASKPPSPSAGTQPEPPNTPASQKPTTAPEPSNKPTPELKLQRALEKAAEKRNALTLSQQKALEQELLQWGESTIPSSQTEIPFQNPLDHLPLSEQKNYLANPPNEYIATLEERARLRETWEKDMFLADPLTYWKFAYATKPDFSAEELPPWQSWSPEKRLDVMEKYRRYDERFLNRVQRIYTAHDSPAHWETVKAEIIHRVQREVRAEREKALAAQKKKTKTITGKKIDAVEEPVEVPPRVLERRAFRTIVGQRNNALNTVWYTHLAEVRAFEDFTEDGRTLNEDRKRKRNMVKAQRIQESKRIKNALASWDKMTPEGKAEKVDWGAINAETSSIAPT